MKNRRKQNSSFLAGLIAVCLAALVFVWFPSGEELASIRTNVINPPPLGRFIYQEPELRSVLAELGSLRAQISEIKKSGKRYSAQDHAKHHRRLLQVEKSLLPIALMTISSNDKSGDKVRVTHEAAMLISHVRVEIATVAHLELYAAFRGQEHYFEEAARFKSLAQEMGITSLSNTPVEDMQIHWRPLWLWIVSNQIQSMIVAFALYAIRVCQLGHSPWILVLQAEKTAFWMMFWVIGLFRYPNSDPVQLVRVIRHRVAVAASFLLTFAFPGFAKAQNRDEEKPKQTSSSQRMTNSVFVGFEIVDKYHGMIVGEIFEPSPAARVMARYSKATRFGEFYVDTWNSFGSGYNRETDVGIGFRIYGVDVSYTHFAVLGGDIGLLAASKTIRKSRLPLAASVYWFRSVSNTSPPGGVAVKLSTSFKHDLGFSKVSVSHSLTLGTDNNPFNLGQGKAIGVFYNAEAGYKGIYAGINLSAVGGNTTRGVRQSLTAGIRHSFTW